MDKENQYIIDNYYNMRNKEISEHLGLTESAIAYRAKKLGLRSKKEVNGLQLTEEDKEFIRNNYLKMPYSEVGKQVNCTAKQVRGWVRNHIKDRVLKIREFNKDYFETIDSPNRAYWLGFIYADGWICANKRRKDKAGGAIYEFGIELQKRDRYILEALNEELGGKHIITDTHKEILILNNKEPSKVDMSKLRVYSKDIVMGLHNNGIDFNKTHSDMFPTVSDDLFIDFLRGYIDGDGCIHKMKENALGVHITGANRKCFEYLQDKLMNDYGISTKIYSEEIEGYKTKYRLYCFAQADVKRLLDLIYQDKNSTKLDRKYKIYQDFYGLAA